jgi:hypothetical protein
MRQNTNDLATYFFAEIHNWNNRHLHVLRGDPINDVPPMHSAEFLSQYTREYMSYVSDDHYLKDPRPRPRADVQPHYTNIPHSYTQQQDQHTFFPQSNTQQQHIYIPEPPSYTQQQQHTHIHPPAYTPQEQHISTPQTINFLGLDEIEQINPNQDDEHVQLYDRGQWQDHPPNYGTGSHRYF